jgi:multicomponent Na+:H+ antiporter subunit E
MILLRRLRVVLILAGVFIVDLLGASLAVGRIVLSPRARNRPAIIAVPVDARTDWGVALFAYFTSLTPGSTCLHVSEDRRLLYLHVLDAPGDEAVAARFKHLYERWILELER